MLTYLCRDEPGYVIGFRIGYTYLSKEAWRRANAFGGIALVILGVAVIAISIFLSIIWLMAVLFLGMAVVFVVVYLLAKKTYESEAPGKPERVIEPPDIRKYLYAQIIMIMLYLPMLGRAPQELLLIMLFMTFFSGKPACPPAFTTFHGQAGKGQRRAHDISVISLLCIRSNAILRGRNRRWNPLCPNSYFPYVH
ncbi:SdpI family protein [Thermococcus sp.]